MKKIFTLLLVIGFVLPAFAQRTSGGSTQSWRRYDLTYDTTYSTVTERINYPSTSRQYFRIGLIRGRGQIAEESEVYYPEWGRQSLGGGDMNGGFEIVYGSWQNMENVNTGLHPAVDMSLITEFGYHRYTYENSSSVTDYTVDYGATNGFDFALGVGATIKPMMFNVSSPEEIPKNQVLIDVGATLGVHLFATGETTYSSGGFEAYYNHEDDLLGARMDANIHLGIRYNFIGIYMVYGVDVLDLYNPEYFHESTNTNFSENFEEDVAYNTLSFGVSLNF